MFIFPVGYFLSQICNHILGPIIRVGFESIKQLAIYLYSQSHELVHY